MTFPAREVCMTSLLLRLHLLQWGQWYREEDSRRLPPPHPAFHLSHSVIHHASAEEKDPAAQHAVSYNPQKAKESNKNITLREAGRGQSPTVACTATIVPAVKIGLGGKESVWGRG